MNINIYQINIDRDIDNRAYMDTDHLNHFFGSADMKSELYDKVFSGEVECETLDDVYRKFNIEKPEGYRGRSLSISDIVEVLESESEKNGFYFCDRIGFNQVNFDSTKTQDITAPNLIAVLYIEPNKKPSVVYIKPELEEMQRLVGGYIEEYMPFDDEVAIICNEEGKINGMPLNRAIYDESDGKRGVMLDIIAGNFFLAYAPYESENFKSLTPEMIKKYTKRFQYPEKFMKINGEIIAVPIKPKDRGHDR
jgi:hypothetical protein